MNDLVEKKVNSLNGYLNKITSNLSSLTVRVNTSIGATYAGAMNKNDAHEPCS